MRRAVLAVMAVAFCGQAEAQKPDRNASQAPQRSYASETCEDLHRQQPMSVYQTIVVTCRWPGVTSWFRCNSQHNDGRPAIEAETLSPECKAPFNVR